MGLLVFLIIFALCYQYSEFYRYIHWYESHDVFVKEDPMLSMFVDTFRGILFTKDQVLSKFGVHDSQKEMVNFYTVYKPDNKQAFQLDLQLAENGDSESQYNLCINIHSRARDFSGSIYKVDSDNVVKLLEKTALSWCYKSANQGYPQAQDFLCMISYEKLNYEVSLNWCGVASKYGYSNSQYILGEMYE